MTGRLPQTLLIKDKNSSLNLWTNDKFLSFNGFCLHYKMETIICESEIDGDVLKFHAR